MSLNNLLNKLNKVDNDIASDISEQHSPEWNMDEAFKKSLKKYHSLMKDTTAPLENENIEYEETIEFKAERITTSHRVKGVICSSCAAAICVASAIIMINIFSAPPMIDENTPEIIDNVKFPGSNSFQITTEIKERENDLTLAEQITQEEYKSEDTTEKVKKNESTIKQESAMSTSEINASIVYAPLQSEANEKANTTVKEDTTITTTINSYNNNTEANEKVNTTYPTQVTTLNDFKPVTNEELDRSILSKWELVGKTRVSDIHSTYDASRLISQIGFMCPFNTATTYFRLNEEYPVEYLNIPDNGVGYCIYKLSDGGKLIIFFDDNPNGLYHVTQIIVVNGYHTKQDFDALSCGMTLCDVFNIDKGSEVLIKNNSLPLDNGETLHIVDGGFIKIAYDNRSEARWTYSSEDYSKFVITSVEFIPNGGFISAPEELGYDYVKGGFNYYISEDDLTDLLK